MSLYPTTSMCNMFNQTMIHQLNKGYKIKRKIKSQKVQVKYLENTITNMKTRKN